MRYLLISIPFLLFLSCANSGLEQELAALQEEMAAAKEEFEQIRAQIEPEGQLVHFVFFKLKPDVDQQAIIKEVKTLETIDEVMDLEVGPFEDLGDARALSEYNMVMSMSFADSTAYRRYQNHPTHLKLRENLGAYLAGPPATYDFLKK